MKKMKYTSDLFALIFMYLSIAFLAVGGLCFVGILKPSIQSKVQNQTTMGIVFLLVGVIFCVTQVTFRVIGYRHTKLHNELLVSGRKFVGTVEKVYLQKWTQYGNKSPFRICYSYTCQGKIHHNKSVLLWDNPNLNEGDFIDVYANDFGNSTLKL